MRFSLSPYNIRRWLGLALTFSFFVNDLGAFHVQAAVMPVVSPPVSVTIFQDVHSQLEAQRDLEKSLKNLASAARRPVRIGVEGAAGPFHFEPYWAFPDSDLTTRIARQFLEKTLISGPVLAGLLHRDITLTGVEAAPSYVANVEAYRAASSVQKKMQGRIESDRVRLIQDKERLLSGRLRQYDQAVEAYRAGRSTLGDYLTTLTSLLDLPVFSLETFVEAHGLERRLDFKAVEREKQRFANDLVRRLSVREAESFQRVMTAGSESASIPSQRLEFFIHIGQAKGLDLTRYPLLGDYRRYLQLTETIDPDRLFQDIRTAEATVENNFTTLQPEAARLFRRSRALYLQSKLIRFELTPQEWSEYRNSTEYGVKGTERNNSGLSTQYSELNPFEKFYELAEQRNVSIADAIRAGKLDAVVVGGFHAPGLKTLLERQGARVILVRPQLTSVDPTQGTSYLTVFARRKTPLERLFSRDKLFLAPPSSLGTEPLIETNQPDAKREFVGEYLKQVRPGLARQARAAARRLLKPVWIRETFQFQAPLSAALTTGDPVLITLAALWSSWGMSRAHGILARPAAGWSVLFTGALFAGSAALGAVLPSWLAPLVALLLPAWFHFENERHLSGRSPLSGLFEILRLSPVRMNIDEIVPDHLAHLRPDVINQYKAETIRVLTEWRATRASLDSSSAEPDPVDRFMTEAFEQMRVDTDQPRVHATTRGITLGFLEVQPALTTEELEVRFQRDLRNSILLRFQTKAAGWRMGLTQSNRILAELKSKADPREEAINAHYWEILGGVYQKIYKDLLTEWATTSSASVRDRCSQDFQQFWIYLEETSWDEAALAKVVKVILLPVLLAAHLTPSQLTRRMQEDYLSTVNDHAKMQPGYKAVSHLYLAIQKMISEKDVLGSVVPDFFSPALAEGYIETKRQFGRRVFQASLDEWRTKGTEKGFQGFIEDISSPVEKSATEFYEHPVYQEAFVAAAVEAKLTPEEWEKRAEADTRKIFELNGTRDYNFLIGFRTFNSISTLLKAKLSPEQWDGFTKGRKRGAMEGVASIGFFMVEEYRESRPAPPSTAAPDMYERLITAAGLLALDSDVVLEGLVKGYLSAAMTAEEYRECILRDYTAALETAAKPKGSDKVLTLVDAFYDALGQVEEGDHAVAIREARAGALSLTPSIRAEYESWVASAGNGRSDERLKNLFARAVMMERILGDRGSQGLAAGDLTKIILDLNLSNEDQAERAAADFGAAVDRWMDQPPLPGELVRGNESLNPALAAILNGYLNAAESLASPHPGRAEAIYIGLSRVFVAKFGKNPMSSTAHLRVLVRGLLQTARSSMRSRCFVCGLKLGQKLLRCLPPGDDALALQQEGHKIVGTALLGQGNAQRALLQGLLPAVFITWKQLADRETHHHDWSTFNSDLFEMARLFMLNSLFPSTLRFLDFIQVSFHRHPHLRPLFPDVGHIRLKAMEQVSRILVTQDPRGLPFDAVTGLWQELKSDNDGRNDRKMWAWLLFNIKSRLAAFSPDENLDEGLALLNDILQEDFSPEKKANLAHKIRWNAGWALREINPGRSQALRVEGAKLLAGTDPLKLEIVTEANLLSVVSHLDQLAWEGRWDEAFAMGGLHLSQVKKRRETALTPVPVLEQSLRLKLASLHLLRGAPGDFEAAWGHFTEIFKIYVDDPRKDELMMGVLDPAVSTDSLLKVAEALIFLSDRKPVFDDARERALRFFESLQLKGWAEARQRWEQDAALKPFFIRFQRPAQLDPNDSANWPDFDAYRMQARNQLTEFEQVFRAMLQKSRSDGWSADVWRENFEPWRSDVHVAAARYAAYGLWEPAVALLNLARTSNDQGKRLHNIEKAHVQLEDLGLVDYPTKGGALREGLQRVINSFSSSARSAAYLDLLVSSIIKSASQFSSFAWKSERERDRMGADLLRVLESCTDLYFRGAILMISAWLASAIGQVDRGRKILDQALGETLPDRIDSRSYYNESVLASLPFLLTDPSLRWSDRVSRVEGRLDKIEKIDTMSEVGKSSWKTWRAITQAISSPTDASLVTSAVAQVETFCRSALDLLEKNQGEGDDIPLLAAELAVAIPAGPEQQRLLKLLDVLTDWIGGMQGPMFLVASSFAHARISGDEAILNAIFNREMPPSTTSAWRHGWQMSEAVRRGEREKTWTALNRLLRGSTSFPSAAAAVQEAAVIVALSPMIRSAFLSLIPRIADEYEAGRWAQDEAAFVRILELASTVGDPVVIESFDQLISLPNFPHRNLLLDPNGLEAALESWLSGPEWLDHLARLDPARVKLLSGRASRAVGADFQHRLDEVTARKAAEAARKKDSATRIKTAHALLEEFKFSEAISELNLVHVEYRNDRYALLRRDVDQLSLAWWFYQAGTLSGDHACLTTLKSYLKKEAAPNGNGVIKQTAVLLKDRLLGTRRMERDFAARKIGPEEVRDWVQTLKPTVSDSRTVSLEGLALSAISSSVQHKTRALDLMKALDEDLARMDAAAKEVDRHDRGEKPVYAYDESDLERIDHKWKAILAELRETLWRNPDDGALCDALLKTVEGWADSSRKDVEHRTFHLSTNRCQQGLDLLHLIHTLTLTRNRDKNVRAVRLRPVVRGLDILKDTIQQAMMLRSKLDADSFNVNHGQTDGPARTVSLQFQEGWHLNSRTNQVIVPNVFFLKPKPALPYRNGGNGRRNGREEQPEMEMVWVVRNGAPVEANKEYLSKAPSSYLMMWDLYGEGFSKTVQIGMTLLGMEAGKGLVFDVDQKSADKIFPLRSQLKQGRLRWVEDYTTLGQLTVIEPLIARLENQLRRDAVDPSTGDELLDQLFGLKIPPAVPPLERPIRFINTDLARDPSQHAAVMGLVDGRNKVVITPGPPGAGKTSVMKEAVRQLIQGEAGHRGDIVVAVSQSNYGLDNFGKRLLEDEVPFVRAAARDTKVDRKLKGEHLVRLDRLMEHLIAHHTTGRGFVYLATNNGLLYDRHLFTLLHMYMEGTPMKEVFRQYRMWRDQTIPGAAIPDPIGKIIGLVDAPTNRGAAQVVIYEQIPLADWDMKRVKISPVLMQEEGSLATLGEVMVPVAQLNPKRLLLFGDHRQLPPHGIGGDIIKTIWQAVRRGLAPLAGILFEEIFTPQAVRTSHVSLYEKALLHSQNWGGIPTFTLTVLRRGHWAISTLFNTLFYEGRLKHKDDTSETPLPFQWTQLESDTLTIVNMDLHSRRRRELRGGGSGKDSTERMVSSPDWSLPVVPDAVKLALSIFGFPAHSGHDIGAVENGTSWMNFEEAGEVVRVVTHFFNKGYKPTDIILLSPYSAQNTLIREVLQAVGVFNDILKDKSVTQEEVTAAANLIRQHVKIHEQEEDLRKVPPASRFNGSRIRRLLSEIETGLGPTSANRVRELYKALTPIYNLWVDGGDSADIKLIGRADVPPFPKEEGFEIEDMPDKDWLDPKTIDSMQGHENKVVIVSFTRSNLNGEIGFLNLETGLKRVNVALSRAQEKLVLVGSFSTLVQGSRTEGNGSIFQRLLDTVSNIYRSYNESMRQAGKPAMSWAVLSTAPGVKSQGSLTQAWGLTSGEGLADRFSAPIWETLLFFALLTFGLGHHDAVWIATGLVLQGLVFPALEWLPAKLGLSPYRSFKSELLFANGLLVSYLGAVMIGWILGWPLETLARQALTIPLIIHLFKNNDVSAEFLSRWIGTAAPEEVDSLGGIKPLLPRRFANHLSDLLPVPALAVPDPRSRRRSLSQV